MEFYLLFCIVAAVAASPQCIEIPSKRSETTFANPFTEYFNIKMAAEGKILRNFVSAQAKLCIAEIEYFIDYCTFRLRQMGEKSISVADTIDAALNEQIYSIKSAYTLPKIHSVIDPIINTLKLQYFAPVQQYIEELRGSSEGLQCYEKNKLTVKAIFDKLAKESRTDIATQIYLSEAEVKQAAKIVRNFADYHRNFFQTNFAYDDGKNSEHVLELNILLSQDLTILRFDRVNYWQPSSSGATRTFEITSTSPSKLPWKTCSRLPCQKFKSTRSTQRFWSH